MQNGDICVSTHSNIRSIFLEGNTSPTGEISFFWMYQTFCFNNQLHLAVLGEIQARKCHRSSVFTSPPPYNSNTHTIYISKILETFVMTSYSHKGISKKLQSCWLTRVRKVNIAITFDMYSVSHPVLHKAKKTINTYETISYTHNVRF